MPVAIPRGIREEYIIIARRGQFASLLGDDVFPRGYVAGICLANCGSRFEISYPYFRRAKIRDVLERGNNSRRHFLARLLLLLLLLPQQLLPCSFKYSNTNCRSPGQQRHFRSCHLCGTLPLRLTQSDALCKSSLHPGFYGTAAITGTFWVVEEAGGFFLDVFFFSVRVLWPRSLSALLSTTYHLRHLLSPGIPPTHLHGGGAALNCLPFCREDQRYWNERTSDDLATPQPIIIRWAK